MAHITTQRKPDGTQTKDTDDTLRHILELFTLQTKTTTTKTIIDEPDYNHNYPHARLKFNISVK